MEAWRNLQPGDVVIVRRGLSETEKRLVGRVMVVERWAEPHRFVVIKDEWGSWHVHPEALEPFAAEENA